jgi:hypothetical protein
MELYILLILLLAIIIAFYIFPIKEKLSGYGIISGLGFNNRALYCFKNPYDPPTYQDGTPFHGYCSIIGKVVV